MRFSRLSVLTTVLLATTAMSAAMTPRVRRGPTAPRAFKPKTRAKTSSLSISPERATQIQTALIHAGYLSGTPSGTWDAETQSAMEKLQADNGWQTKIVPDSRALIKLGLGANSTTQVATALGAPATDAEPAAAAPSEAAPAVSANR